MAAGKKGPVFRVTGLPASQLDEELMQVLKDAIDKKLSAEEKSKLAFRVAIAPSCYNDGEKIALVEFYGEVPAFLSFLVANPLEEWQIEMGDEDISFDEHFFGFTQLYAPRTGSSVTADVIAITGLDGHAYTSWEGKGNLGRMWLRDFLSKDLPYCRTMIYGYNSKLTTHGVDTIMDYGRELLEELKKVRNTEELAKRPLFFIAHGFGGIILGHCLVKAVQTNEGDHPTIASLHDATYGMLLFGIPHKGLVVADLQKKLAGHDKHPRSVLLEQIKKKSDLLAFQLVDFKNLIRDRKIVSFYETAQTRQLEMDTESNGSAGVYATAVEADSALLELPDSMEDKIPLASEHAMLVKFDSKNNRGYTSVRDKLLRFEEDAPSVVAARFARTRNGPKPSAMIPLLRDRAAFVGREDILAEISKRVKQEVPQDHVRVALVGLSGVGKSHIAIEYAYRMKKFAPLTWIFWVHASSVARFEQAYRDIAAMIKLPGLNDPKADITRLVYNWMCDETNGQWLMVLDNVDDQAFSSARADSESGIHKSAAAGEETPFESLLPKTPNGRILITSQNMAAAVRIVGTRHNVIKVDPMAEEDALILLKTRIPISGAFEDDARTLIGSLDGNPLAVIHAASYIAVSEPRITVSAYLQLFRESKEDQTHLINMREARDIQRDDGISDAVITTWQISFEQLRKTRLEAANMLLLMSMFDRQGIPEYLLYSGSKKLQLEDTMAPLTKFGLIKRQTTTHLGQQQPGKRHFEMHSLVQLVVRKWLEVHQQADRWQQVALRIMANAFSSGQHETWTAYQVLVPHVQKVLDYGLRDSAALLDRATISDKTSCYLLLAELYKEAENMGRQALVIREKILGRKHPSTLTSVSHLGTVLKKQGKFEEAEEMQRRALQGFEKACKPEHPSPPNIVENLRGVFESTGKPDEVEVPPRRSLEAKEKFLGATNSRY